MLTALSSLSAKRELSPQAGEDYGFAEPALTIEVTAAGETDTYTFGVTESACHFFFGAFLCRSDTGLRTYL